MTRFIQSTTLVSSRNRISGDQIEAEGAAEGVSKDIMRVLCHPAPVPQFSVEAKSSKPSTEADNNVVPI